MSSVLDVLSVRFLCSLQLGYPEAPRCYTGLVIIGLMWNFSRWQLSFLTLTFFWEGHVSSESSLRYQEALHGVLTHFNSKVRAFSTSLRGETTVSLIV